MSAHALLPVLLVVYTVTPAYVPGMVRSVASVRARFPGHLVRSVALSSPPDAFRVRRRAAELGEWRTEFLAARCPFATQTSGWRDAPEWYRYLRSPSIWMRLCIADTLPAASRVLYLDADTVVARQPPHLPPNGGRWGVAAVLDTDKSFHTGVMWLNLERWRLQGKSQQIQPLLAAMPPAGAVGDTWLLNRLFLPDEVEPLDPRWNVMGLGEYRRLPAALLDAAWVLHWTGPRKPWKHKGLHIDRWKV